MSGVDISRHINIIAFNIPYPADYGGVIDVFYKIVSLHKIGIKIHLHCYEYGRDHSKELNKHCETVTYYKRNLSVINSISLTPYIVISRNNINLLINLQSNTYPVLFEGLHTTYLLGHKNLKGRQQIVRTHNIEHEYYYHLYKSEKRLFKKIYLGIESLKLKIWEKKLGMANNLLAISLADTKHFNKYTTSTYLPAFHHGNDVYISPGKGDYILYHGNLAVQENIKAVTYLINNVFNQLQCKIIIAGKDPSSELYNATDSISHIKIVPNPSDNELQNLISQAQVNVLITFQATGIKLKLINALYSGRHCLVNTPMVEDTELAELCEIEDTPNKLATKINELFNIEFSQDQIDRRKLVLDNLFSNTKNAEIVRMML